MRLLNITFDTPIQPWEVPAFRGAVAKKVGYDHDLFHNHNNINGLDTHEYHHRYPLIQYKQHRGMPMMLCLEEGVEALHHLFEQPDMSIDMAGSRRTLRVAKLDVREHRFEGSSEARHYHLRDWLALNEENYAAYRKASGLIAQIAILEKILQNQLVALCYAFGHAPPDSLQVQVQIQDIHNRQWVSYKDVKVWCFSLEFSVCLDLPNYLGIGKGASTGWGVLRRL